ncbi:hypothetical protein [Zhongshania sp.]|uniref:hypothetical protein n=1 Tax=Zhongshania sp. TaxID=1971902 RepID=UPI00356922B3
MSLYEWSDLLSMRRWPVPGHSTMYSAEAGGKVVSDDLINRLQGKYSVGPKGVYEDRDFGSFTPAICKEAAEEITRLRAKLAEEEIDHGKVIAERDYWETKATELANDIGEALGFDVGEHNNMNCPVQNAIDGVAEMRSQIDEWHKLAEVEGRECDVARCKVTNNPVGTDTWAKGYPCSCVKCQEYLLTLASTHPAPAKVPEGWMLFPVRAWEFLQGINDLEGCDFGEPNPKRTGKFWWRRTISEMLKSQGGE